MRALGKKFPDEKEVAKKLKGMSIGNNMYKSMAEAGQSAMGKSRGQAANALKSNGKPNVLQKYNIPELKNYGK